MITIRPAWNIEATIENDADSPQSQLIGIQIQATQILSLCHEIAENILEKDYVSEVHFLLRSGNNDLVAGCELARAGYLKQAYSLWRSWFEQAMFTLYFLEAPIHRAAWKVSLKVELSDNPKYRLMLHQLLNESSEKHPFSLVYNERYESLISAIKATPPDQLNISKLARPISRANKILTLFSQGVHGTFQPKQPKNLEDCSELIANHCLTPLKEALDTVVLFWALFLTSEVSLPHQVLIDMKEGKATIEDIQKLGLESSESILNISALLKEVK